MARHPITKRIDKVDIMKNAIKAAAIVAIMGFAHNVYANGAAEVFADNIVKNLNNYPSAVEVWEQIPNFDEGVKAYCEKELRGKAINYCMMVAEYERLVNGEVYRAAAKLGVDIARYGNGMNYDAVEKAEMVGKAAYSQVSAIVNGVKVYEVGCEAAAMNADLKDKNAAYKACMYAGVQVANGENKYNALVRAIEVYGIADNLIKLEKEKGINAAAAEYKAYRDVLALGVKIGDGKRITKK